MGGGGVILLPRTWAKLLLYWRRPDPAGETLFFLSVLAGEGPLPLNTGEGAPPPNGEGRRELGTRFSLACLKEIIRFKIHIPLLCARAGSFKCSKILEFKISWDIARISDVVRYLRKKHVVLPAKTRAGFNILQTTA